MKKIRETSGASGAEPAGASFREKWRYQFENLLSRGTVAIIGLLGLITLAIVAITALVVILMGMDLEGKPGSIGFADALWESFMRSIDAGTVASDKPWPLRLIFLFTTIGGIFIVGALIGTLSNGLTARLEDMRKGRSRVIEQNHTLILGWSSKIYSIISELIVANLNQKNACIVILAPLDKVQMEDLIRSRIPHLKNTRLVCRSGSPLELSDLAVVNPNGTRSIIVLSPEESNPDTWVIKSILALTNNPGRRTAPFHIVAEIRDQENLEAAHLVAGNEAVLVQAGDLIARVTAQTCRQSGLSVVYTELLDFDGVEIYFTKEKSLVGKSYKDALMAYEDSAVMGVFRHSGEVLLNPARDTKIGEGDQIIAISEDDDTLKISGKKPDVQEDAISIKTAGKPEKERTLILGWNDKGETIAKELDNYVGQGSEIHVVAQAEIAENKVKELSAMLEKCAITFQEGKISDRTCLDSLQAPSWDHIIILCYPGMDVQEADAITLICLLHLRAIAQQAGVDLNIVSEMLDIRNRDLAEVTQADDFIVSDKLISLMLSQISENKHLKKVFDYLFSADGSEIYMRPVRDYVRTGVPVNFYTLIEAASRCGQTAIGYRIQSQSHDVSKGYGVKVNPVKSQQVTFAPEDMLILLAEE